MSKAMLIRELSKLQMTQRRMVEDMNEEDPRRIVSQLEIQQIELEMQNRELQESHALLEESRSRYAELYDYAPAGYCTLDRSGHILEINLTGAALLDAQREELIHRSFRSALARISADSFHSHLKRCAEEKARISSDLRLVTKRGTERVVRMITDPVPEEGKPPAKYRAVLIDVTDETRLENDLRLLSNLGAILVSAQEYGETIDAVARILVPAFADLLKVDLANNEGQIERMRIIFADPQKQQVLAEKLKRFYPRSGSKTFQTRVLESGEPILVEDVQDEVRDRMAHDEEHAALLKAAEIRSMMFVPLRFRGKTFGVMTFGAAESGRHYTANDCRLAETIATRIAASIDTARLAEDRKKAISARDAILAVVSHDLRNSLNVIQLKAYMMLQSENDQIRTDAAFIQRRTDEMRRLIQDLLDVSSLEAGQLRLEKSFQPVLPILKRACEPFELLAAQKSITLQTDFAVPEELHVPCDADRIQQVLGNLIGNALKFTGEGGSILVRVMRQSDEIWFSVTDSGPGIPETDLPHIFDRFWSALKRGRPGTGLGLSIAKGLIEAHAGRIWAESKVGMGSTFFFALPLLA